MTPRSQPSPIHFFTGPLIKVAVYCSRFNAKYQPWLKWGLGSAVLILFAVLFAFLRAPIGPDVTAQARTKTDLTSGPNAGLPRPLRQAYLAALAQQDTAKRLVALQNFVRNAPRRDRKHHRITAQARAQISILIRHENTSWANTSNTAYHVHQTPAAIQAALMGYTLQWGRARRADGIADIERLYLQDTPLTTDEQQQDSTIAFQKKSSRYRARGRVEMAGKAPIRSLSNTVAPPKPVISKPANKVQAVRPKRSPSPRYPSRAKQRKINAVIIIAMDINTKGKVERVSLISAETTRYRKDFIRAAKQAAKRSRFHPEIRNGHAVAVKAYQRTYRFNADN